MKMYVGNLPFDTNDQDLRTLFGEYGQVTDVHLPSDRETGRPRGFAFVTMDSKEAMEQAIKALDGQDFQGRNLRINEAQPRESFGGGGGGPRGGGYGGGGNRGGYGGDKRGGGGGYGDKRGGGGYGGGGGRRY
jgi:RNA recognition motif-containing protein